MKYKENLGIYNCDCILGFDDLLNNTYFDLKDFYYNEVLGNALSSDGTCFESIEDESKIKTLEGKKFYNDVKNFINSEEFKKKFYYESDGYSWRYATGNQSIRERALDIALITYYNKDNDYKELKKYSALLPFFIGYNFWDFYGNYSFDIEFDPKYRKSNNLFRKLYRNNELVSKRQEAKEKDSVYKADGDIWYFKYLEKDKMEASSKELDYIYELYIDSYENVEVFGLEQFQAMIRNLNLFGIDMKSILKENKNITKNDIYRLLIYTTNTDNFYGYINILNNCDLETKEKVLNFIKPCIYYYNCLPKGWAWTGEKRYTSDLLCHSKINPSRMFYYFGKYVSDSCFAEKNMLKIPFEFPCDYYTTGDLKQYLPLVKKYYNYVLENILYEGNMEYALSFQDVFANQVDIVEKIVLDNDKEKLDQLLQMKKDIIENPIKTKPVYKKMGDEFVITSDNKEIEECKEEFISECKSLVDKDKLIRKLK